MQSPTATAPPPSNALAACAIFMRGLQAGPPLAQLLGPGLWTVFVPTDLAFAVLPDAELDRLVSRPQSLTRLLEHHVVPGLISRRELARGGWIRTLAGERLAIDVIDQFVLVDGAQVLASDISLPSGVAHTIDRLLRA